MFNILVQGVLNKFVDEISNQKRASEYFLWFKRILKETLSYRKNISLVLAHVFEDLIIRMTSGYGY